MGVRLPLFLLPFFFIPKAFPGTNGFTCMDRTLLFQLDMIPSARQGSECGLQWEPSPVHYQNFYSVEEMGRGCKLVFAQSRLGQRPPLYPTQTRVIRTIAHPQCGPDRPVCPACQPAHPP